MLGLSKEELIELGYFGKTEEESIKKLYGTSKQLNVVFRTMVSAIRDKTIELILANNEQIAKQLKDAGIELPT
jgi:hypothetical protein